MRIEVWRFSVEIQLPNGCGNDWIVWYTDCCLSGGIDNIDLPASRGLTLYTTIDNTLTPCNNSPIPTAPLPFLGCFAQEAFIEVHAYDRDSDQVSLSLAPVYDQSPSTYLPLSSLSYFSPVPYAQGFSPNIPFTTTSGYIWINTLWNFIPASPIRSLVAFKIEEYRNAVKISEGTHVGLFVFHPCSVTSRLQAHAGLDNAPSILYNPYIPATYTFTLPVDTQLHCLSIQLSDSALPPPENTLFIEVLEAPGTVTLSQNNTPTPLLQVCWNPAFSDQGEHPIVLRVWNNRCPSRTARDIVYLLRITEPSTTSISTFLSPFVIVPNPTSGPVQLCWSGTEKVLIKIYTSEGRLLGETTLPPGGKHLLRNLEDQPHGIYFFQIITTQTQRQFPVIKLP
jgi:hypothetical protein